PPRGRPRPGPGHPRRSRPARREPAGRAGGRRMMPADELHGQPEPPDLADQADQAIRALNHLTPEGLEYPGDLYEVIASLKLMAQRLPQLFGQLTAWLE